MEPSKRVKDVLANGGDWIDVRGSRSTSRAISRVPVRSVADRGASGSLSGGERSRLLLARIREGGQPVVLDEPTNDLDLETLDLLQEVIADYDGTVLIVSHDRRLPRPDRHDHAGPRRFGTRGRGAGGYEDWVRQRHEQQRQVRSPTKAGGQATARPPAGTRKLSYKDQRDYDRLPGEIERRRRCPGRSCRSILSRESQSACAPPIHTIAAVSTRDRSRRSALA